MGSLNAAKSTIVSLFLGKQLKVVNDEEGELKFLHANHEEKPEIGEIWG